jgi:hypothetical protein
VRGPHFGRKKISNEVKEGDNMSVKSTAAANIFGMFAMFYVQNRTFRHL